MAAKNQQVALKEGAGLPASTESFTSKFKDDIGKGFSTSAADKMVPMLRVLQALSPQVKSTNPAYIQGAKEGMILMNGAPTPVVDGDEGFLFQHCHHTKHIVEWIPRESGGGLVGRHSFVPADHETMDNAGPRLGARKVSEKNRTKWIMPGSNNELTETRYHTGNVILGPGMIMPFTIPFSGSGHQVSKAWHSQLDMYKSVVSVWGLLWRITTKPRRNAMGEWFVLDPKFIGYVEEDPIGYGDIDQLYRAGRMLHDSMETGDRELGSEEDVTTDNVI